MSSKTKKRGQITVFMILGIILLLSTAAYLIIKNKSIAFRPKETVPPELKPLKLYIETCIKDTAEPGVYLLGMHGGYIDVPEDIALNPDRYLSLAPGIPDSGKIPYWYYEGKPRNPSKKFMEEQLSSYIKKEISKCIKLSSFDENFDIREIEEPKPQAKINLDNVVIELNYPLEIKNKQSSKITKLSYFVAEIPIRLGRLHELATLIMDEENSNTFLEELTMDMIATANTDNGRLPYEGTEFTCSSRVWSIEKQLKPDLQKILKYNLHFLKFKGTEFNPILPGDYQAEADGKIIDLSGELNNYYYTKREKPSYIQPDGSYPMQTEYGLNYLIDLKEDYSSININTVYEGMFGMKLGIYPSNGDTVKAMEMDIPIIGSCIKLYHHFYTLEYPVLFVLTDLKNPAKPFVFNLATPVIINKNNPERAKDFTVISDEFRTITGEDYCKRKDHLMEIRASDDSGNLLDGVEISYQCLSFVCDKGAAQKETLGGIPVGEPKIRGYFPTCINGLLIAKKPGYLDFQKSVSIGDKENPAPTNLVIEMTRLKKLDYEFKIFEIENGRVVNIRGLADRETVFLTLKNKNKDYERDVIYPTEFEQYKELNMILGDYSYDLSIKLMNEEGESERVIGGFELLDWNVRRNDLFSSSKATFFILVKKPIPKDDEEMGKTWVEFIQKESKNYKPIIK